MDFLPPKEMGCHLTGFKEDCRTLVASGRCKRWTQIMGHNPNTGEPVNRYDCADNWLPMLMIENSQMQRQTGAAVEHFRNIMVLLNGADPAKLESMLQQLPDYKSPQLANGKPS